MPEVKGKKKGKGWFTWNDNEQDSKVRPYFFSLKLVFSELAKTKTAKHSLPLSRQSFHVQTYHYLSKGLRVKG